MKDVYTIAYKPGEGAPGKWRKIRVSVTPPLPSRSRYTPARVTSRLSKLSEFMPRLILVAATLLCPLLLAAQQRIADHNFHGWFSYFGDHPIAGSKWGIHLEGQFRRHDVVAKWQQLLLRPGVNYQASRSVMLTAGYAFVRSNIYSEFAAPAPVSLEHRLWQQAWVRYRSGKTNWSTRLRFENRFLGGPDARTGGTSYRFENRFRAWQQVKIPLSRNKYFTAYDEFWVYVKPFQSNSFFDQNRAYAAVGFDLKPSMRLELGYMNQALLVRSGSRLEHNHTIMVSLFSSAGLFGGR